jgi:hypothetical protein
LEKELELYIQIAKNLRHVIQDDIGVTVTDTEHVLYCSSGNTIDIKAKVGDKIDKVPAMREALNEGKITNDIVPKEVLGVPFKGTIYPIKDERGNIIGTISTQKSLHRQAEIKEVAENIHNSLQKTNATIEEIATGSENLSYSMNKIVKSADFAAEKIQETDSALNFIKAISSQSNLLALNASIESARAGEAGKGFSVVAGEMKKLSQLSSESAKKVSQTLLEMRKAIDEIIKEVSSTSTTAEAQAAATQEISATIGAITSNSDVLVEISKKA